MTEHIKNRQKLKAIYNVHRFDDLLDMTTLSTEEKKLLRLHYIEKKDFRYIGDMLGYSEATIKAKHKKIIKVLGHFL
jgi:DNA-directed RNA polymerase specialized sigma subunit